MTGYLNLAFGERMSGKASRGNAMEAKNEGLDRPHPGEEWELRMFQAEGLACDK